MSDLGRKNFSDKATESLKPDSQKTSVEQLKETVTDNLDKAANKLTPDEQKSFGQTLSDKAESGADKAKAETSSGQHGLAETASEYLDVGKEKLSGAVEYISGAISGAKEGGEATKK